MKKTINGQNNRNGSCLFLSIKNKKKWFMCVAGMILLTPFAFANETIHYGVRLENSSRVEIKSLNVSMTHGKVVKKSYTGDGGMFTLASSGSNKDTSVIGNVTIFFKDNSEIELHIGLDEKSSASEFRAGVVNVLKNTVHPAAVISHTSLSSGVITITLSDNFFDHELVGIGIGALEVKACGSSSQYYANSSSSRHWSDPCGSNQDKNNVVVSFSGHMGRCYLTRKNGGKLTVGKCDNNSIVMKVKGNNILFLCQQKSPGDESCSWVEKSQLTTSHMLSYNLYK
ncbi:hypothetical protein [Facilibium subflavum]|uniref:hypothetical protein n=1 Tax=Facilibium subflavum TaxID=2219058 RepID=UPI000E65E282|nr:hypothetical protein [Facilibium subflavum]